MPSFKPSDKKDIVDEKAKEKLDKIQFVEKIKENPPPIGSLKTEIKEGLYEIDLDTLLRGQIVDAPSTVIPMLIDHHERVAVDVKESYKPERRRLPFQYWWLFIMLIGFLVMIYFANMFLKMF